MLIFKKASYLAYLVKGETKKQKAKIYLPKEHTYNNQIPTIQLYFMSF